MRAISLHQPWASAVVWGIKTVETRHWKTKYRGPIAIHAAQKWTKLQRIFTEEMAHAYPLFRRMLKRSNILPLPVGAIVGTVDLFDCQPTRGFAPGPLDRELGNFGDGRWAWLLENARVLPRPVPLQGRQAFFTVADELIVL